MKLGDDLLFAIVSGIATDPPWQDFVHLLRRDFAASHANVIFRRSDLAQALMTSSSSAEVAKFGDLTARHVPSDDPIAYYDMEPFRAYAVEEFLPQSEIAHHPFLIRFLKPLGMGELLICKATAPPGMHAWISVTRGEASFAAADRRSLERVARFFGQALTVFGALKNAEDQRDAYKRVVRARSTGMAQVDQHGAVLHCDDSARELLNGSELLGISEGKLRAAGSADCKLFETALARVIAGESGEEFLVLGRDQTSLEVLIMREQEPFEPAWSSAPRATLYMGMVGRKSPPSQGRLMTLFGLTRREASLAALLADGLTLNEASGELGIAEQTGRAYLRQIFQKTGVVRQAELVMRIQGSIGAITQA